MRFNDRITFAKRTGEHYDPILGKTVEGEPIKDTKPCNLSRLGVERTNQLFGQIDRVITVARLQQPYNNDFDYILIGEQRYNMQRQSDYRKGVFFLEGVSNG